MTAIARRLLVATAKEVDDATEEMGWRQVHREEADQFQSKQFRWPCVTAAVEEEHLEPDIDAPRSPIDERDNSRYGSVLGGGLQ